MWWRQSGGGTERIGALFRPCHEGSSAGLALALHVPDDMLSIGAGCIALLGIGVQRLYLRSSKRRGTPCLTE